MKKYMKKIHLKRIKIGETTVEVIASDWSFFLEVSQTNSTIT
jgi:hypothetical protein